MHLSDDKLKGHRVGSSKEQTLFAIAVIVGLYYLVLSIGGFSLLKSTRIPHISVQNSLFALYDNTTIDIYAIGSATGNQTSVIEADTVHVANFYPDDAGAEVVNNTAKVGGAVLSLSSAFIGVSDGKPFTLTVESQQFLPYIFIVAMSFLVRAVFKLLYVFMNPKTTTSVHMIFRLSDIQFMEQICSSVETMVVMRMIGVTDLSVLCGVVMFVILFETLIYSQHEIYYNYFAEIKRVSDMDVNYEYSAKCWIGIVSAVCIYLYVIVMCGNFGKTFDVLPDDWEAFTLSVHPTAITLAVLYFLFRFLLCTLSICQVLVGEKMLNKNPINIFINFQLLHNFLHVGAVTVLAACVFSISVYEDAIEI